MTINIRSEKSWTRSSVVGRDRDEDERGDVVLVLLLFVAANNVFWTEVGRDCGLGRFMMIDLLTGAFGSFTFLNLYWYFPGLGCVFIVDGC